MAPGHVTPTSHGRAGLSPWGWGDEALGGLGFRASQARPWTRGCPESGWQLASRLAFLLPLILKT